MSKKSVGLSEKAYSSLVRYRGNCSAQTGSVISMSEAVEQAIEATKLVDDYNRYQQLGGKRPLRDYEARWKEGRMKDMEDEIP